MPKFLSYDEPVVETRTIEILSEDGSPFYITAKRLDDKILVQTIANVNGHICTAKDLVKETRLPVESIKKLISEAFLPKK